MNPSIMTWSTDKIFTEDEIKDGFISPIENGVITSYYGSRINPITFLEEFHDGLDIAADLGTPVMAIADGIVTKVYTSSSYGNTITYETYDGYKVFYAHLHKMLVEEGEEVVQGEVLGEVGSTGMSTGNHLHCTLWKNDELLNPIEFISIANSY